jgi:hypothetical protein
MKLYSMYKGTWFFLVLFCGALLLGGPAHSLLEDHGGEVVTHCDGHSPLDHLEGAEGDHDILPCDLCLTLSGKFGFEPSCVALLFLLKSEVLLVGQEGPLSSLSLSLPLLRAPPALIL